MNIQEMHSWFDVLQDKGDAPYFTVAEKTQFLNRAQIKFINDVMFNHYLISGKQPEANAIPYNSMASINSAEDILSPLIQDLQTSDSWRKAHFPDGVGSGNSQYTPTINQYGQISMFQLNKYVQGMLKGRNAASYKAATWEKAHVLHILSLSWSAFDNVSFRYVRKAEYQKMQSNSFRGPTIEDPVYFIQRGGGGTQHDKGVIEIQPRTRPDGGSISNLYDAATYVNYDSSGAGDQSNMVPSTRVPSGGTVAGFYGHRLKVTVIRSALEMHYDPLTWTESPVGNNSNVSCELPSWTHDDIMSIALEDAGVASRDEALLKMSNANKGNIGGPKYSTERTGQQ